MHEARLALEHAQAVEYFGRWAAGQRFEEGGELKTRNTFIRIALAKTRPPRSLKGKKWSKGEVLGRTGRTLFMFSARRAYSSSTSCSSGVSSGGERIVEGAAMSGSRYAGYWWRWLRFKAAQGEQLGCASVVV